jgi:hypothetical protein
MAIVHIQETPADSMETYEKVNETAGVSSNPPDGLIAHSAGLTDGKMVIVDFWESQEAFDRFSEERLMPAIREVMGGDPPEGMADVRTYEAHNIITG